MLEPSAPVLAATSMVQPVAHRSVVSLAAFRGQTGALNQALGLELPSVPRRIVSNGAAYLWSGPNCWLVISEDDALLQTIRGAVKEKIAAVTDQSDGHFLIRIIGPNARKTLAKLVPIDLHENAFPADAVAITLAGYIGVKIWREDNSCWLLACFRSYAEALAHAVIEAAHEFEIWR